MTAILSKLNGVKTYIIVGIFLLCVAAEKFAGFDIPGFQVGDDWLGMVLAALGLGALRSGITTEVKKVG